MTTPPEPAHNSRTRWDQHSRTYVRRSPISSSGGHDPEDRDHHAPTRRRRLHFQHKPRPFLSGTTPAHTNQPHSDASADEHPRQPTTPHRVQPTLPYLMIDRTVPPTNHTVRMPNLPRCTPSAKHQLRAKWAISTVNASSISGVRVGRIAPITPR